jgi:hypothetical protein
VGWRRYAQHVSLANLAREQIAEAAERSMRGVGLL